MLYCLRLFKNTAKYGKSFGKVYGDRIPLSSSSIFQTRRWKMDISDPLQWRAEVKGSIIHLVETQSHSELLRELKSISMEELGGNVSADDVATVATNLCVENQTIDYGQGCDMFDLLYTRYPDISTAGYGKLIDLCIAWGDCVAASSVFFRASSNDIHNAQRAHKLVRFLLQRGEVQRAVDILTSCPEVLTADLLAPLAEPLFLGGMPDTFISLLRRLVALPIAPSPAQTRHLLVAVLWARARCGLEHSISTDTRTSRELQTVLDQLTARLAAADPSAVAELQHSRSVLATAFSREHLSGRAKRLLCGLRWRHISREDYSPFPYLQSEDPYFKIAGSGNRFVPDIKDLTSQLYPLPTGDQIADEQRWRDEERANEVEVLFCHSLWPDQYAEEVQELVKPQSERGGAHGLYDNDDDDEGDGDDYDSSSDSDLEVGVEYTNLEAVERRRRRSGLTSSPSLISATALPGRSGRKSGQSLSLTERAAMNGMMNALYQQLASDAAAWSGSEDDDDDEVDDDSDSDSDTEEVAVVEEEEEASSSSDEDSDDDDGGEDDGEGRELVALRSPSLRRLMRRVEALGAEPGDVRRLEGFQCDDLTAQVSKGEAEGELGREETAPLVDVSPAPLKFAGEIFGKYSSRESFVEEEESSTADGQDALELLLESYSQQSGGRTSN